MIHGYGLEVVDQVPIIAPDEVDRRKYLETKREKMGHLLPVLEGRELVLSATKPDRGGDGWSGGGSLG